MITTLKFVQGAVGKKDLVPALTHFRIKDGRITGYNGKLSLSAPIALDVDCCPKAESFVRAVQTCEETAQLHLTPTGKLSIRSGKFRAHVDTLPTVGFPEVQPEGQLVQLDGKLIPAMSALYAFTADDASRPWAAGILFDGGSAYATNNVAIAEYWLGYALPYKVNIPRSAIKEMLRIGEEPITMQVTVNSVTFHYEGERWLRTQLNAAEWPRMDSLVSMMPTSPEGMVETSRASATGAALWEALDSLSGFVDALNRVYFLDGKVSTATEEGASVDIGGIPSGGIYNHKMLSLLAGAAEYIDFAKYPRAVPWLGKNVRGLIMPMRGD